MPFVADPEVATPEAHGFVPDPPSFIPDEPTGEKTHAGPYTIDQRSEDYNAKFAEVPVGQKFLFVSKDGNVTPYIKTSDKNVKKDDSVPAVTAQEKGTGDIQAFLESAGINAPSSAAFLGAMGATSQATQSLAALGPLGRAASVVLPVGAGIIAAATERAVQDRVLPGLAETEKDLSQTNPAATKLGQMASSGFRPGGYAGSIPRELLARGVPAALGGGIQLGSEVAANYDKPELVGDGAAGRIGEAALTNAILNKSTRLGEFGMGVGAAAAERVGFKTKAPSLVTQVDSTNVSPNDIALSPRELKDMPIGEPQPPLSSNFAEGPAKPLEAVVGESEPEITPPTEKAKPRASVKPHEALLQELDPDSLAYLKESVLAGEMTPEEYRQEVTDRATRLKKDLSGPSEKTSAKVEAPVAEVVPEPVKTPEKAIPEVPELARYNELDNKMGQMVKDKTLIDPKTGDFTEEFRSTWKELEDIKNRNGGMPPGQEAGRPPKTIELQPVKGGEKAKDFIKSFGESFPENPLNSRERIVGDAVISLSKGEGDNVNLDEVRAFERGKGQGNKALKAVLDKADQSGITLELYPKRIGTKGLGADKLKAWYERNGFVMKKEGYMTRKPQARNTETNKEAGFITNPLSGPAPTHVVYYKNSDGTYDIHGIASHVKGGGMLSDALNAKPSFAFIDATPEKLQSVLPAKIMERVLKGDGEASGSLGGKMIKIDARDLMGSPWSSESGAIFNPFGGEPKPEGKSHFDEFLGRAGPVKTPENVSKGPIAELEAQDSDKVALGSDQHEVYQPFLTGMKDSENPIVRGLGHAAELMRQVGTVTDNIRAISPVVAGRFRRYLSDYMDRSVDWSRKAMPAFKEARSVLDKDFDEWSTLLLDGKMHKALQLASTHEGGEKLMTSLDEGWSDVRDEILADHQRTRPGETYEGLDQYYPRIVSDRQGLMKALEQNDPGPLRNALDAAIKEKGSKLTPAEESAVLSKLVYQSAWLNRGKPGYLKERTIDQLGSLAKYFEPVDVAIEQYINRSAKDITTREFFGKVDPEAKSPWLEKNDADTGPIGDVLSQEVKAGKISPEGQSKIVDSINSFFKDSKDAIPSAWYMNRLLGAAATVGYLGDFANGVTQAADAFLAAVPAGPKNAAKGYAKSVQNALSKAPGLSGLKPKNFTTLEDLGIHEGNIETADFARNSDWASRTIGKVIKTSIGLMDTVGKEATLNAIRMRSSEIARNPESRSIVPGEANFPKLNERMQEMFPDEWPKMLGELKSEDFKQGKLSPETRFYLFNRLSDIQPVSKGELPEGFLKSGPMGKIPWRLTSYMTRQLGYMRNNTYEELKKGNVAEAASWFAAYTMFMVAGNSFVQFIKDKAQGKKASLDEYAVGALTSMVGANRYAIAQAAKGDVAGIVGSRLLPQAGIIKDAISDLSLGRDYLEGRRYQSGEKVVRGPGDFLQQLESTKYLPFVGKELYGNVGKGALKEKQRARMMQNGTAPANTLGTLRNMVSPGPKSGSRP